MEKGAEIFLDLWKFLDCGRLFIWTANQNLMNREKKIFNILHICKLWKMISTIILVTCGNFENAFADILIVNKTYPRKDWNFFHVWWYANSFSCLTHLRLNKVRLCWGWSWVGVETMIILWKKIPYSKQPNQTK